MHKIAYPKTTNIKSFAKPIKANGASKNVKLTPDDNSTKWSLSFFEHVKSFYLNSTLSLPKKSFSKGIHINKPSPFPLLQKKNALSRCVFLCTNTLTRL